MTTSLTGHPIRVCPFCGEGSRDGHLCHKCTGNVRKAIVRVAQLWVSLEEAITRQDHLQPPNEVRAEVLFGPLPFRLVPSEVAKDARQRLSRWVGVVVATSSGSGPENSIGAYCRYLLDHTPMLRVRDDAEEWADDMTLCRDQIAGAVDLPAERSRVTVGPCPERTDDEEPCSGIVVAVYPSDMDESPHMDCTPPPPGEDGKPIKVCARSWTPPQWAHLGARIAAKQQQVAMQKARVHSDGEVMRYLEPPEWLGAKVFLTVADASVVCGVPLSTLHRWVKAGEVPAQMVPATVLGKREVQVVDPAKVAARQARAVEDVGVATRRARVLSGRIEL